MKVRLRGAVIVLTRTLTCFGNQGGDRRAAGTNYGEGDTCPQCKAARLKTDRNGSAFCDSCGWEEADG